MHCELNIILIEYTFSCIPPVAKGNAVKEKFATDFMI